MPGAEFRWQRFHCRCITNQFDADHRAFLANLTDIIVGSQRLQLFRDQCRLRVDVAQQIVAVEELQAGQRRGTSQRVARVRVAVEEGAAF